MGAVEPERCAVNIHSARRIPKRNLAPEKGVGYKMLHALAIGRKSLPPRKAIANNGLAKRKNLHDFDNHFHISNAVKKPDGLAIGYATINRSGALSGCLNLPRRVCSSHAPLPKGHAAYCGPS
jgi:hypothetical protein